MASKKTPKPKEVKESNPVVPVIFRRTITGYPKAGSFGYLDADLFESWKEKGHVVSAVDKVTKAAKTEKKQQLPKPVKDDKGITTLEVQDEIDPQGKSSTARSDVHSTVYEGSTKNYGRDDS